MIAEKLVAAPTGEEGRKSPFKFLDYFTGSEEDRRRFGGRDREIHDLVTRITNERTLVLFGPSGIGKTSLLLAGVFPALEERGVRPVYVRTLRSPLTDLCRELGGTCADASELREAVVRATAGGPVAVVLDQIEELFLRFTLPEREAFAAALGALVDDPSLRISLVFSLRMDFLGRLDELEKFLPALLTHRYPLLPLTPFGIRQAVTRPLRDAKIDFEPAIVSRLIAEMGGLGFDPFLLQIQCRDMYKQAVKRAGDGPVYLTVADVRKLEGRGGAFFAYLNGVAEALPPGQRFLACLVLDALVTSEGTKRAVRLQDLPAARFHATEEEALAIAGCLTELRLLRREEREKGELWYELVHDRLISVLQDWLNGDGEFSRFRQARAFVMNNAASGVWKKAPGFLGSLEPLLAEHRDRFLFKEELEMVVRNAIFYRSGQLPFWADQYHDDQTRALLLGMLNSGTGAERLAAAASARLLTDDNGTLAGACRLAALRDESPTVRAEAASSLAKFVRSEDFQALRLDWKDRKLRPEVWKVYTILHAQGVELANIPWHHRIWARHLHAKQVRAQADSHTKQRFWAGARAGAWAGGLWCLSHFGLGEVVRWVRGHETFAWRYPLEYVAAFGLLGAVLGLVLGGLAAFAASWEAALRGEGRWLAAMTWRRPYVLLVWLTIGVSVYGMAAAWRVPWTDGIAVAVACVLPLLTARWCQACVWPGASRTGSWLAGTIAASGLPVLLFLVLLRGARAFQEDLLAGRVVLCGILVSGMSLVAIVALAHSAAVAPLGPVPPVRKGLRWVLLRLSPVFLAAVPVFFVTYFGTDTYLPKISSLGPNHKTFLKWDDEEKKLNPIDPPVFEIEVPNDALEKVPFALQPAAGPSDCQALDLSEFSGSLVRRFLKAPLPSDSERKVIEGWCLIRGDKPGS